MAGVEDVLSIEAGSEVEAEPIVGAVIEIEVEAACSPEVDAVQSLAVHEPVVAVAGIGEQLPVDRDSN